MKNINPTPAHVRVREAIEKLIRDHSGVAEFRLPGENQLAIDLAVSRMTVNKVMVALERDGIVRREKGRGTFAVPRMTTKPRIALALVSGSFGLALQDYYFGSLYWGIRAELDRLGMDLEMLKLGPNIVSKRDGERGLIAINPPEEAVDELLQYSRLGNPIVLLGASWEGYALSTVDSENFLGAAMAVNHLIDLGHRKIDFLGACASDSNTQDRLRGFEMTLKSRGIDTADRVTTLVETAYSLPEDTAEFLIQRVKAGTTAIFAAGPHLAIQLLAAANRRGIKVPEQLSIVGYDDPATLEMVYPKLTTVRQPLARMAEVACEILIERLESKDPRTVRRILDPELVVRESTAPCRPA